MEGLPVETVDVVCCVEPDVAGVVLTAAVLGACVDDVPDVTFVAAVVKFADKVLEDVNGLGVAVSDWKTATKFEDEVCSSGHAFDVLLSVADVSAFVECSGGAQLKR